MDYENENGTRYDGTLTSYSLTLCDRSTRSKISTNTVLVDEAPRYERDRSASPRPTRRNDSPRGGPRRSASPNGNGHADSRSVFFHLHL